MDGAILQEHTQEIYFVWCEEGVFVKCVISPSFYETVSAFFHNLSFFFFFFLVVNNIFCAKILWV